MEHVHSHIWLHVIVRQVTAGCICHIVYWVIPIARRICIVTTNSLGVPVYAMAVGWHFLNGQKSSPPWWQKLAEEYKICTLHVTCHSQVKHTGTPTPPHFSDYLL